MIGFLLYLSWVEPLRSLSRNVFCVLSCKSVLGRVLIIYSLCENLDRLCSAFSYADAYDYLLITRFLWTISRVYDWR